MSHYIGPALPPHLQKTSNKNPDESVVIGPSLPPEFQKRLQSDSCDEEPESINCVEESNEMYGPALPPGFRKSIEEEQEEADYESDDEEDEMIGPTLPGQNFSVSQKLLDNRAAMIKKKFQEKGEEKSENITKREDWMLELPPERAAEFGLGPRQFRKREKLDIGDRSVWTDTPQDKLRKLSEKESCVPESSKAEQLKTKVYKERDKHMEQLVEKHKTKNQKSLLEMHQNEIKKKKKLEEEAGTIPERKPFSREDLKSSRFDEAQKKSIFKKAQLLNSRFSSGESKFL